MLPESRRGCGREGIEIEGCENALALIIRARSALEVIHEVS
jgi:hypothetical protein